MSCMIKSILHVLSAVCSIPLSRSHSGGVCEIRWYYPVRGYPELTASKDSPPAIIECRARDRVEERLEVTLSGVAPSSSGPKRGIKARAITPSNEKPKTPEGVVVGESECKIHFTKLNGHFFF